MKVYEAVLDQLISGGVRYFAGMAGSSGDFVHSIALLVSREASRSTGYSSGGSFREAAPQRCCRVVFGLCSSLGANCVCC